MKKVVKNLKRNESIKEEQPKVNFNRVGDSIT